MRKSLVNYLGLLGIIGLLSYTIAVIFAPAAYPNYDWMAQAISDLSAQNAPSRDLWDQLASLYGPASIVSVTMVCVFIQSKLNKSMRMGIYLFGIMSWISMIGYSMFPLSDSGYAGAFQDKMHIFIVTPIVILLSIISLIFITKGGIGDSQFRSLAVWAGICLGMMMVGSIGTMIVPKEYFGIAERMSVFSVPIFNAILGIYLYQGF